MNIREKLSTIQAEFKAKKSRKNNFGNYMFRSAEDILEALKPYNKKHGVYFTIRENLTLGDFPILHSTATIVDAETGDQIEGTAVVGIDLNQKGMQMPQKFGSASSYGKKYALGNLFLIDDTQDADHGKAQKAKPKLEGQALTKAKAFLKSGGSLDAIKGKYEIPAEILKTL